MALEIIPSFIQTYTNTIYIYNKFVVVVVCKIMRIIFFVGLYNNLGERKS